MLRHAIAPLRRFTKVSHDLVRHPRLNSDAKLLLIHVQGLPDHKAGKPLGEHATDLGMKPRAYQRAKQLLVECGYFHEWQWQDRRGRWNTDQLCSNVTLTREEASRVRHGVPPEGPPSAPEPAVGEAASRSLGGPPPVEEDQEKNAPHPPPQDPDAADAPGRPEGPGASRAPEVAQAERVLLSLRHTHPGLLLGVREARGLADAAAEWLRRGLTAKDLHRALTQGLPADGVRSAVGFVRHRLVAKLPAPAETSPPLPVRGPVACAGPGDEHYFRPLGDETHCGRCRTAAAAAPPARRRAIPWRALVEQEAAARG
ncbi:hypothetical protein [Streptomyces sp. NRRL S-118]|uniref:hypothetical protein n=1 Tax=Streptomyces sp. NRRL S-118 TaxID=1463881 RepID=UPI0004C6367D|nr:hypothetical protein [Streptomyces sp. NRRL S-118]